MALVFGNLIGRDACLIVCTLRVAVAIYEFDDGHRCHVAIAEAGLQDADIATLTVFVAWAQDVEQFRDILVLLQLACSLTTRAGRRALPM